MFPPEQERPRVRASLAESLTALINLVVAACLQFGRGVTVLVAENVDRHGVIQALDLVIDKLYEHPFLTISLFGCALVCTLPIITFLVIAAASFVFTFFGFVFIEGIILIAAFLLFIPCFIGIVLFMVAVAIGLTLVYVVSLFLARILYTGAKLAPRVNIVQIETEE